MEMGPVGIMQLVMCVLSHTHISCTLTRVLSFPLSPVLILHCLCSFIQHTVGDANNLAFFMQDEERVS